MYLLANRFWGLEQFNILIENFRAEMGFFFKQDGNSTVDYYYCNIFAFYFDE